jgi:hypothetical protein
MDPQAEHDKLNHFINQALGASWPLFAIATIVFCMRTSSRIFFTEGSIGWEDYIISLSWVGARDTHVEQDRMLIEISFSTLSEWYLIT